jgi:Fe-S-cluster formation regulator IscX/YfhJ
MLHIEMKDIGTDLMELSLFLPTMEQAIEAKERFLEDPTASYKKVLEALAGEI